MIAFIITLRSKQVARDWGYTCSLLSRTLISIQNQTDQDFKVILICHEIPDIPRDQSNLIYYQVDFPPPSKEYTEMLLDRDIKEIVGRQIARKLNANYIMVIDADDCLHKQVVEFLNGKKSNSGIVDGYFIDEGYIYFERTEKILSRRGFHHFCGSTVALRPELYDTPESSDYRTLLRFYNEGLFFSHGSLVQYWQSRGKLIKPFPFKGCIYVRPDLEPGLDTTKDLLHVLKKGDLRMLLSPVKRRLEFLLKSRCITQELQENFSLYKVIS
jgi:hypothetical protein